MNTSILSRSIQDFFTKEMLSYAFLPFVVTILVLNSLFFYGADSAIDSMQQSSIQVHQSSTSVSADGVVSTTQVQESYEGSSIFDVIFKYILSSSIFSIIVTVFGSFIIFIFAIFVALIVIGFLTPFIVKSIHKKHYTQHELHNYSNMFSATLYTIKTLLLTLLMLLLFIPLYFIPLIQILAFNFPFYYMFHKLISFDVSSNMFTKEEFKKVQFFNNSKIRLSTLGLFILSLVPFAILFTPVFIVVYMTHLFFSLKEQEVALIQESNEEVINE